MASCPLCNTPVTEDFGLIECSNCGAQLMVHMDGRVVYSGGDKAPIASEDEALAEEAFAGQPVEFDYNSSALPNPDLEPTVMKAPAPPPVPEEEEVPPPPPPFVGEAPVEDEFVANEFEPEPEAEPAQEEEIFADAGAEEEQSVPAEEEEPPPPPPEEEEPVPDFLDEEPQPEPEAIIANPPPGEDISDIAQFGNSESSSGRDGSLRYNLIVTGIDTSDVRENFREAITDRKLIWDTDQILRSIRNGEVRITNVSAAKAHIVVSRLRELPVRVSWEQYALAQS